MQERGWQGAYRHVFPVDELDRGGFIQADALARATRAAAAPAGATFVAERRRRRWSASPRSARAATSAGSASCTRSTSTPTLVDRRRPRADRASARSSCAAQYAEATLWVLEDNPRARRFYERAGWHPDGARKAEERWGVRAPEVRYRKSFTLTRPSELERVRSRS